MPLMMPARHSSLQPVFSLLAFLSLSLPALAGDVFASIGEEVNGIFEKSKSAVVQVRSGTDSLAPSGTGFFIDNQGTLVTADALIGESATATVQLNDVTLDAKILGRDTRSGVALLRVAGGETPFLTFGKSSDLKTGYGVIAIGFPLNLPAAPSSGLISGFDVRYLDRFFATTHIHANLPISAGEIGGPLLNTKGEVIGLMVNSPDDGRSVYALPSEAVQKILGDFAQNNGTARHGWVGVVVDEAMDAHDGRTVKVAQLAPGTPASESGIQPGDTVMRIDAREIYRPADVLDAAFFSHVGGTMSVLVRRDDKLLTYNFTVKERPIPGAALAPDAQGMQASKMEPVPSH